GGWGGGEGGGWGGGGGGGGRRGGRGRGSAGRGEAVWAIPGPCLHEFYGTVTRPRLFSPPSTPDEAIRQIDIWLESPSLLLLSERSEEHTSELQSREKLVCRLLLEKKNIQKPTA